MGEQLTSYIQTRLTDFSDYRTSGDLELTHLGALKTILSEACPEVPVAVFRWVDRNIRSIWFIVGFTSRQAGRQAGRQIKKWGEIEI